MKAPTNDKSTTYPKSTTFTFPRRILATTIITTLTALAGLTWYTLTASNQRISLATQAQNIRQFQVNTEFNLRAFILLSMMDVAQEHTPILDAAQPIKRPKPWPLKHDDYEIKIRNAFKRALENAPVGAALYTHLSTIQDNVYTVITLVNSHRKNRDLSAIKDVLTSKRLSDLEETLERTLMHVSDSNTVDRFYRLRSRIMNHEYAQTMATALAAQTGDDAWHAWYVYHGAELQKALNECEAVIHDRDIHTQVLLRIRAAHKVTANWERLAFENIAEGQGEAVQFMFHYETYQRHKVIYQTALSELTQHLDDRINNMIATENESQWVHMLVACVAVALLVFLWIYTSQSLKDWHSTLLNALGRSKRAEKIIRDTNGLLEQRIGERTKALHEAKREQDILQNQLQQSQKMESIGRLAGGVAHDFNNLLMVVSGHCELLLNRVPKDDPIATSLNRIYSAGQSASDLVKQLLAFSRQQVLQPTLLNVNDVVREVQSMLNRVIGDDVSIQTLVDPGISAVLADAGQMKQVLMNLAVNARDAMPDGGQITFSTSLEQFHDTHVGAMGSVPPGAYVKIQIQDTGHGMDTKTMKQIFEPFFTTKDTGKGTGLGLATVYGIIQQSQGYILVDSKLHHGTQFEIYLPAQAQKNVQQAKQAEPPAWNKPIGLPENLQILVVEDEVTVQHVLKEFFQTLGISAVYANDGDQGYEAYTMLKHRLDLVITDVMMPGLRGDKLAAKIREETPNLPIIYMSGYANQYLDEEKKKSHGFYLLNKPFGPADLLPIMRKALSIKSLEAAGATNGRTS